VNAALCGPHSLEFTDLVPDLPFLPEGEPSRQAALLLRAIATIQDELATFGRKLQRRADVARVTRELDCFGHSDDFPTAPKGVVSWYVEAEFRDGTSRCYDLDVFHDGQDWIIDSRITQPGRDGPEPITVFATRRAPDIPRCIAELSEAVEHLQQTALRERELSLSEGPHN
jgi:hypothetical protein